LTSDANPSGLAGAASGTADNQKFISQAYHDLLNRAPDPNGLAYWMAQLNAGATQGQIAGAISHSAEYYSTIINPAYQNYLGRPADRQGLAYWISRMQSGLTDEQLEANFVGSAESYAHAGGTDVKWVGAIYIDLLGRPADPQGEAHWTGQLANGVSRYDVGFTFATSAEHEQQRVEADYLDYLHRPADQQGLDYWVNQLLHGSTNEDVITSFVGSSEYFALATNATFALSAHLADDTGVSSSDGITSDPTVVGQIVDAPAVTSFVAGFDGTPASSYVNILPILTSSGTFSLPSAQLAVIFGGSLPDGPHTLHLVAGNTAGNTANLDVAFTLDTQPPTITIASPANNLTTATNVTVTGGAVDATSGVALLQAAIDSGAYSAVPVDGTGHFSFTTQLALDGTADGPHVVHFQTTDLAGNVSSVTDLHFTLATVKPAIDITSPAPGLATNEDPTVSGQVTGVLAGTGTLQAAIDSGPYSPVSLDANQRFNLPLSLALDGTADGQHVVHFKFSSQTGETTTDDYSFTLDTIAPTVTIVSPASGTFTNQNETITGHVADVTSGVASLVAAVDAGTFSPVTIDGAGDFSFTTAIALNGTIDGPHTVHFKATDKASNTSSPTSLTFTLDTQSPVINVTSPAAGLVTNQNITIAGSIADSQSDAMTLTAALDGGNFSDLLFNSSGNFSLTTSLPLDGTADGPHTIHFKATDKADNTSLLTDYTFTLDTVAPTITIVSPASGTFTNQNETITGHVTDATSGVASLVAAVDAGAFAPVTIDGSGNFSLTTTLALDGTTDGLHTVLFKATDKAGNTSSPTSLTFTVDTKNPVINIASPAAGLVTNQNVTVAGTLSDLQSDLATLTAAVDSGSFSNVSFNNSGGFTFTTALPLDGTADGSHTVHFKATDKAGNMSVVTDYTFTLDTIAPTVTIVSPTSGTFANRNETITGHVADATSGVASLVAAVDAGAFAPVTVDGSGNFSFTTALALDGTADGPHTVRFEVTDKAGNTSSPTNATFTLDTQNPVIDITSPAAGLATSQNVTIAGNIADAQSDLANLTAAVDSGSFSNVSFSSSGNFTFTTGLPLDGTADGPHTVHFRATDQAGNTSVLTDYAFTLDTVAPTVTIVNPASGTFTNQNTTVTGQVTDATSGVASLVAAVDSGAFTPLTVDSSGNFSFTTALALDGTADGPHTVRFEATDKAGNTSSPISLTLTLDTQNPVVNVTSPAAGLATNQNVSIAGNIADLQADLATLTAAVDSGSSGNVSVDSSGNFTFATGLPLDGSADGPHTVEFTATDKAGNTSVTDYTFTLDTIAPTITIASPASGQTVNHNLTITGQAVEAGSGLSSVLVAVDSGLFSSVAFDNSGNFSFTTNFATDGSADGLHTVRFEATDKAGNASAVTDFTMTLGTVAPTITSVGLAAGTADLGPDETSAALVTLVGQANPGVELTVLGTNLTALAGGGGLFQIPGVNLVSGANSLTIQATDDAGNTSQATLTVTRGAAASQPNAVIFWNQATLNAIQTDGTDPVKASRALAMVQAAVYDAVNNVAGDPTYYVKVTSPADSSVVAAVDSAAHDVLGYVYPAQQATFDTLLTSQLALLPSGQGTTDGETVGQAVGNAIIALRANDGSTNYVDFEPGTAPGDWQPTPPMYAPALDPQWANLTPFALTGPNQFDPAGPPALSSQQWADAVNQVESLGAVNSTTRTAAQTTLAQFWNDGVGTDTPSGHWNAIAQTVAQQAGDSLTDDARLFAELDISMADAGIATWNTKYLYDTWRPVTVIQSGGDGVNPAVTADATWTSLLTNPNFPEYVSGHSTFSMAAATVLDSAFGDNVTFTTKEPTTSLSLTYNSFQQAATDAGMSRMYGGIHFIFSIQDGWALGTQVANWDLATFNVTKDTTPPKVTLNNVLPNAASNTNVTITGQVTDNLSGVASLQVQVDDGTYAPLAFDASTGNFSFTTSFPLDGSADGSHTLHFQATDKAGNVETPAPFTFTLVTQAPTLTLTSPTDGGTLSTGATLTGTVTTSGGANIVCLCYAFDGSTTMIPVPFNSGGTFNQALDLSRLAAGSHTLLVEAQDAAGNKTTQTLKLTLAAAIPLTISSLAPAAGSTDVGVTFRPKVVFSRPIDTSTLNSSNFYAADTTGAVIPATIVPSADGTYAWLFFTGAMPGASTITLVVNGATIKAADGSLLDAAGSGTPGSELTSAFTTVSTAPVPGTTLSGIVADPGPDDVPGTRDDVRSGPDGLLGTADDVYLRPIQGVQVYILGHQDQAVSTDSQGRFSLTNVPSGDVKLALEGNTSGVMVFDSDTQKEVDPSSEGFYFPQMVMDLTIKPGVANTVMGSMGTQQEMQSNVTNLGVYLPRVQTSILQTISNTQPTTVGVAGQSGLGLTPQQQQGLTLTVQPGSAIGMDGKPMTNVQVGISTVPPQIVMDMLPAGVMQHTFDITIQAPGVATFTTPAQLTFPNVFNAAPGTQLNVLSFDHTTGRLVIDGTATVSPDGETVVTDPGTGVTQPGWHGLTPPGSPVTLSPPVICDSGSPNDEPQSSSTSTQANSTDASNIDIAVQFNNTPYSQFSNFVAGPDQDPITVSIQASSGAEISWTLVPADPSAGTYLVDPSTHQSTNIMTGTSSQFQFQLGIINSLRQTPAKAPNAPLAFTLTVNASLVEPPPPPAMCTGPGHTVVSPNGITTTISDTIVQDQISEIRQEYEDYKGYKVNGKTFSVPVPAYNDFVVLQAFASPSYPNPGYVPKSVVNGAEKLTNAIQAAYGHTVTVKSAYRDPKRNFAVNGQATSNHMLGLAVDLAPASRTQSDMLSLYLTALKVNPGEVLLESSSTVLLPRNWQPPTPDANGQFTFSYKGIPITLAGDSDHLPDTVSSVAGKIPKGVVFAAIGGVGFEVLGNSHDLVTAGDQVVATYTNGSKHTTTDPLIDFFDSDADHVHAAYTTPPTDSTLSEATSVTTSQNAASMSTAPGFGSDPVIYYRFVFSDGYQLGGKIMPGASTSDFLPPDRSYLLYMYQPSTNMSKVFSGETGASGAATNAGWLALDTIGGVDSNGDGIPDAGKIAIGLNPYTSDPDPLGISATAALDLGLDPLGEDGVVSGDVAALPLSGEAQQVVLSGATGNMPEQVAYVATGSYGLAIVDASQFTKPTVLGQLQLPGKATSVSVDPNLSIAAVADGSGGLDLVDVSSPAQPKLLQTISVNASQVVAVEGIAYAAVGNQLKSYDMLTGEVAQTLSLGGGTISGLVRDGSFLYTIDNNNTLRVIDISQPLMVARGGVALPQGGGGLVVGGGVAYVAATSYIYGGYETVDVSNPDNPTLIAGTSSTQTTAAPNPVLAVNGSGTALVANGAFRGATAGVQVYNSSDPTKTGNFVTDFPLPASPNSVTIASGIAFVADGSGGLQVVNYLPFDTKGIPPTINLDTSNLTADPTLGGFDAVEGSLFSLNATVSDDVQVRNVELLVNGQVVTNNVSFPFDLSTYLPTIASAGSTVTVQISASDTGGNTASTNPITIHLQRDTTPPKIIQQNPPDGGTVGEQFRAVVINFSKSLDPTTIVAADFELSGPSGTIQPQSVELRLRDSQVEVVFPAGGVQAGDYTLTIHAAMITDVAGNALGTSDLTSTLHVAPYTEVWLNPSGGDWNDPSNWDTGRVPTSGDDVLISVSGNPTITFSSGTTEIHSLLSLDPFQITGGTLTAGKSIEVDNTFVIAGGTLKNTLVTPGSGGQGITFSNRGATLDNVTSGANLDLSTNSGASVNVLNNLTLNQATIYLGNAVGTTYGDLFLNGGTLGGTGTVLFGRSSNNFLEQGSGGTFTIGPNITIRGGSGTIDSSGAIVNQGTIVADDGGGSWSFDHGYNSPSDTTSTGSAIDTSGVTNPAPQEVYQTAREYPSFSYVLTGLTAGTSYTLRLHFADFESFFAGERLFNVSVNGTQVLSNFDIYAAAGGQDKAVVENVPVAADANGRFTINFNGVNNWAWVNGIEVDDSAGNIVKAINAGLLPGGPLTINSNNFINQGTVSVSNGETLSLNGAWTNSSGATISANGATLDLDNGAVNWTNEGTISVNASTLNLGGQAASMGNITISGSQFNILGTFTTAQIRGIYTSTQVTLGYGGLLDNTNDTLTLDATTGSWTLAGGTIVGGTYTASGGAGLVFTNSGGTLDGLTADSNLDLSTNSGANVNIVHGLTLSHTTIYLGNAAGTTYGDLIVNGGGTLGGTGTVLFGRSSSNSLEANSGTTFTIGPNITIHGNSGTISSGGTIINQGTIAADDGGRTWGYDRGYGNSYSQTTNTANAIDTSNLTNPAPQEVYQTAREYYNFGYVLTGLTAGTGYTLRLHFADFQSTAAGRRVFDVSVNGTQVLSNFDIYAAAGGQYKAVVENVPVTADANGQLTINFNGINNWAWINGIEVDDSSGNIVQTVNAGLLPGGALTIVSASFTNQGTVSVSNGETLSLNSVWTNTSGATISANGATLNLSNGSATWTNNGTISVNDSTLNLGGQSASMGNITISGSQFNILGTFTTAQIRGIYTSTQVTLGRGGLLDNTNDTLALDATTGPWTLAGGTIVGGTYTASGGAALVFTNSGGTLDGVTADSNLDLSTSVDANVNVIHGLTLNHTTVYLGNAAGTTYGIVSFTGRESLAGTGTVLFGKDSSNRLEQGGSGATFTIGPNIAIRGSSGTIDLSGDTIVNQGTISADDSGGGSWSYDRGYDSPSYYTAGTANVIDTSGVTSPAPQEVYQTAREYSNFSYVLTGLSAATGYTLRLHFADFQSTFAGQRVFNVSVNGTQVLSKFDIYAAAGGQYKAVVENVPVTADANGHLTINFGGVNNWAWINGIEVDDASGNIVQTVNAGLSPGGALTINSNSFTNQGAVSASNGETLSLNGAWTNASGATISASGGTLSLGSASATWTNIGMISVNASTLNLAGQSASMGNITISGSQFNILGTFTTAEVRGIYSSTQVTLGNGGVLDNTNDTLALDATTGSWTLAGGTIVGGIYTASGGAGLLFTNSGGTLDGITADSNLDLSINSGATVTIVDGLTLNHTAVYVGNAAGTTYGTIFFTGRESLAGTGTVLFGKNSSNGLEESNSGETLTVGPNITIRGSSGTINFSGDTIVNQGTISADDSGGGSWSYDHGYNNPSYIASTSQTIDTSGVINPAPQEVYQTAREYYNFSYVLTGLTAGTVYTLRLHFADFQSTAVGQRVFNVSVNGTQVLSNFDIYATAGGQYKAVVENVPITAESNGQLTVNFSGINNWAWVNGIEVDDSSGQIVQTVNAGLLPGGALTIDSNSFTNQGTVSVSNGETLTLNSVWTNASGATISASGATLSLSNGPTTWTNNGTISVNNSTLNLRGQSGSMGNITINGSQFNILGTFTTAEIRGIYSSTQVTLGNGGLLDNTNDTLALDATTGSWTLAGGTIVGGTYTASGGAGLVFTNSGGTLDGLTADSNLDLSTNTDANVNVVDSLTLNQTTVYLGNAAGTTYGILSFSGRAAFAGAGTVLFGKNSNNLLEEGGSGGTLTIGPNITIRGNSGTINFPGAAVVNQGMISADDSTGGALTINANSFTNQGTVSVSNGEVLSLNGVWTNTGGASISADSATLNLGSNSATWSNNGTIKVNASTLNLRGQSASMGNITISGSQFNILGTFTTAQIRGIYSSTQVNLGNGGLLDNAGDTLALDATTGSWTLAGGTISGGTYAASGGAGLIFTNSGGTLDGLTAIANLNLSAGNGVNVTVVDGLTLHNATIELGNAAGTTYGYINFTNTETLGGAGTVLFGKDSSNYLDESSGSALTIGPNITVRGSSGTLYGSNTIINQGTISADDSGGGSWSYDHGHSVASSQTANTANLIDTSGVTNPAPQEVYQTAREYSSFGYTLTGLNANQAYTLRLHFADFQSTAAGQRVFDVSVNGTQTLSNFDIYAAAGGQYKAVVENVPVTADANGELTIAFSAVTNWAWVNGIEVDDSSGNVVQTVNAGLLAGGTLTMTPNNFTNQGTVSAGNGEALDIQRLAAPMTGTLTAGAGGTVTVSGALTLDPTATVNVALGGVSAAQFGQIDATGAATLAGTLNVSLANGFQPTSGDSFKVMTFGSETGQFTTTNGTNLANNLVLAPVYDPGDLTLVAGAPQLASPDASTLPPSPQPSPEGRGSVLSTADLADAEQDAIGEWAAAGLDPRLVTLLKSVDISVAHLGNEVLAITAGNRIIVSDDADGYGWFLGPDPTSNADFTPTSNDHVLAALAGTAASGRFDLLTVLEHEFGHILGLPDETAGADLMATSLAPGIRRTPSSQDIDAIFTDD
jgi:hypothetical protein